MASRILNSQWLCIPLRAMYVTDICLNLISWFQSNIFTRIPQFHYPQGILIQGFFRIIKNDSFVANVDCLVITKTPELYTCRKVVQHLRVTFQTELSWAQELFKHIFTNSSEPFPQEIVKWLTFEERVTLGGGSVALKELKGWTKFFFSI